MMGAEIPRRDRSTLFEEHRRILEVGSAAAREVHEENGAWTVTDGRQLPEGFSRRQRARGRGMLFAVHRPNGKTDWIFRPDAADPERPGLKYEARCKGLGAPGNVLGIHPSARHLIEDRRIPVIFVEGVKKMLSIVSAARRAGIAVLVVAISGVWNWLSGGEPIADMLDIPVDGREVYICFDSDVFSNPDVGDAARRLGEHLIGRGAAVYLAHLPDRADGSKMGADDYLASGHTYRELMTLMRAYNPADLERVRLTRNERLREMVVSLRRDWYEADWMRFVGTGDRGNWARGHTARDVDDALIYFAARRGKPDSRGIVFSAGTRAIAERSAKSAPSVAKAIKHLEAAGYLEILPQEDKSKPRIYRLLVDSATLYSMEKGTRERESKSSVTRVGHRCKPLRYPTAPRLRWSSPARKGRLIRHTEGDTGRTLTVASGEEFETPYIKRLGPHRGAVIDALEAASGELHLKDLCEALHRERPWDVRRRVLKPLEEAGIIECEGDVIRLATDWTAKLEEERERKGEIEQAEKQIKEHREQSARYREHLEREKRGTPKASHEAARRTEDLRRRRLREIREEEERDRAPTPPAIEALVARILSQHDRVRMGLLCEIAMDEGLRWRDVPPAVRRMGYRVERLAEYNNAEFIFAKEAAA